MYNPELLFVEANLEEDRLPGVVPGNAVLIRLDAFAEPFQGRVVWVNKSTGAQFALMPRNVVSGEFARVVQRVPVRIEIERRRPLAAASCWAVCNGHYRAWPWRCRLGRGVGSSDAGARDAIHAPETPGSLNTKESPTGRPGRRRHDDGQRGPESWTLGTGLPILREPRHWLAALAIVFVFFTPYKTMVQTVIADVAVRKGIEADQYDMTWVTVGYGVGVIYGVFVGLSLSARIGGRYTLILGMLLFSFGNVLCGAATGLVGLALARLIEGFGKMVAMTICRVTLYKEFNNVLLVSIGFYGVFAYSTRHVTPLVNAYLDVCFVAVDVLVLRAGRPCGRAPGLAVHPPDRPPRPVHLPIDWLASRHSWSGSWRSRSPSRGRKWGGWSSNLFAATIVLCVALPVALVALARLGFSPDERAEPDPPLAVYVLCLTTRGLMLLHLVSVLTIIGMYCTELHNYPESPRDG